MVARSFSSKSERQVEIGPHIKQDRVSENERCHPFRSLLHASYHQLPFHTRPGCCQWSINCTVRRPWLYFGNLHTEPFRRTNHNDFGVRLEYWTWVLIQQHPAVGRYSGRVDSLFTLFPCLFRAERTRHRSFRNARPRVDRTFPSTVISIQREQLSSLIKKLSAVRPWLSQQQES